jgi:molybdenum cofactor cytidylyltransferase
MLTRIHAVLPAAGESRRMGRPKLLLPYDDVTVVGGTVRALLRGGVQKICLVARPEDTDLVRWAETHGLEVALNPRPELGMLGSILSGVEVLGGAEGMATSCDCLLVTPADLPALQATTVAAVIDAVCSGVPLAVPVHDGRRGHPLAMAATVVSELSHLDLSDEAGGLAQLLDRPGCAPVEVPVEDPGAIRDVDTPEDYREVVGREVEEVTGAGVG